MVLTNSWARQSRFQTNRRKEADEAAENMELARLAAKTLEELYEINGNNYSNIVI